MLEKFYDWLLNRGHRAPAGSCLGKPICYTLKRWDKLVRYLEHACITPDNNLIENEIRPFALGRRNWLFADHPHGAEAAATYFSLIAMARACGLDPHRHIRLLLEKFPFAESEEDYQAFLPQNVPEDDLAPYRPRHSLATLLA